MHFYLVIFTHTPYSHSLYYSPPAPTHTHTTTHLLLLLTLTLTLALTDRPTCQELVAILEGQEVVDALGALQFTGLVAKKSIAVAVEGGSAGAGAGATKGSDSGQGGGGAEDAAKLSLTLTDRDTEGGGAVDSADADTDADADDGSTGQQVSDSVATVTAKVAGGGKEERSPTMLDSLFISNGSERESGHSSRASQASWRSKGRNSIQMTRATSI